MSSETHVPFATAKHQVHCAKYSTSLDARGYIPVYEYVIANQPILWDRETGYVYWTGIWKAMGREKSEIAKLVDANTQLSGEVKKIRGGFLKIQGTWLPYEYALELAIKTCWYIREDLEPIFGPSFLSQVLDPTHPGSTSRVPIPLEERQKKDMEAAISRRRGKSGMVSPPTTPKSYSEDAKNNKRKLKANSDTFSNKSTLPPFHLTASSHGKRPKYENFNHEFVNSPQQLGEAIYASLCLQRLSTDDGSRPSNEIIYTPPVSFIIGKQEFQFVDQQYRLTAQC